MKLIPKCVQINDLWNRLERIAFVNSANYSRLVETGELGGGLQLSQIFAKVDLLLSENNSEMKKIPKKQANSNSSKTTGNITLVHFI